MLGEDAAGLSPTTIARMSKEWEAHHERFSKRHRRERALDRVGPQVAPVLGRVVIEREGAGSKTAALAMAYKLLATAHERWRRFNGHELVADVLDGVKFKDGIKATDDNTPEDGLTDEKVAA